MDGYQPEAAPRGVLATALLDFARDARRQTAREFLEGLSRDELQFIADFLGVWRLEPTPPEASEAAQVWADVLRFQRLRRSRRSPSNHFLTDLEHKTLLLFDYLWRCGYGQGSGAAMAARH
jgi:hypothetical protein